MDVTYESVSSWMGVLKSCRGARHSLESQDSVMSQHIGFVDLDTGIWYRLPLRVIKIAKLSDDLMVYFRTPFGRQRLIAGVFNELS